MQSDFAIWSRPRARLTGVVYLLYFLTAIAGAMLSVHHFDALGHVVTGVSLVSYVAVTFLFYGLFRPVSRAISVVAAILSLAGCGATALALVGHSSGLSPLLFFGPFCIAIGYLVIRSHFLPWVLGALMVAAGIGWIAFLAPFGAELSTIIKIVGIFGEATLMLWLIACGVDVGRWNDRNGIGALENGAVASGSRVP